MEKETFLTFILGKEHFAVNVKRVLEVLEEQHITPVPRAPESILGIINFRGEIVSVADTRKKFNMPLISLSGDNKYYIIIFEISTSHGSVSIAATADSVKDVIEIAPDEIKPIPEMGINFDSRYILGTIKIDDKFIMLIDIEKIFSGIEIE